MPADRLLNTVLQYYQDTHDAARTEQIIGTTTHLLSHLSNPLNLGVLTSQLLTARAIWSHHDGLRTSIRIISIYNTAAIRVHNDQVARAKGDRPVEGGGLRSDEWVRAVVKGADERSQRWQHLLVLTGVLMGMESDGKKSLPRALRHTLENAIVTAANLAFEQRAAEEPLAAASIVMALNFAFPLLSDFNKTQVNCDALLPLIVSSFTGEEGFREARFLEAIGPQVVEAPGRVLSWSPSAPSFLSLQEMNQRPLMGNLGPMAKLAAFAVQHAGDSRVVLQAHDSLLSFSRRVLDAWQRMSLSHVDPSTEGAQLSPETLQRTWPVLLQVLKKLLFAAVAILQAIVARGLLDPNLYNDRVAPDVAAKSLKILRNLHFIASRDGSSSFESYAFAYMASIDVISRFASASELLLQETRPSNPTVLSSSYIQRTLDLFYLNLAEHLPLILSTEACDELAIKPALSYLSHDGPMNPSTVELFEAAHSAILSVLSCPQHSALTIRMAPFYIVKLFESFPRLVSPRQFRVAFKTVMQIVSPPFPIAAMEPQMTETLLEMLRGHMEHADTAPLPQEIFARDAAAGAVQEALSEQSALTLTLVDSLPFLPLPLVEEWLTISGQAVNEIADAGLRETVKKRFWDILVSGEMDVERAAIGVAWWGTKGGRDLVLYGRSADPPTMSGAIIPDGTASRL